MHTPKTPPQKPKMVPVPSPDKKGEFVLECG